MKTMSYVFGRILSSEINRSIARAENNKIKIDKIKRDCASGLEAHQALTEWAKVNPDHPLLARYVAEANKINEDLKLDDATRIAKMARITENAWRLAQEEVQVGTAKALPTPPKRKYPRFRTMLCAAVIGVIGAAAFDHKTKQPEPAAAAAEVFTPAPTPASTPAATFTPTETSAKSGLIDYPFPDSTPAPTPAKRRSYKHHD